MDFQDEKGIKVNYPKEVKRMKKTILLVVGLTLIFSLCGTASDKKTEKLARKAEEAITEAQNSLAQWKTADLIAPPEAINLLEKAQSAYETGSL